MFAYLRYLLGRLPSWLQNILRFVFRAFVFACALIILLWFLLSMREAQPLPASMGDKNVSYIVGEMDRLKASPRDLGRELKLRQDRSLLFVPVSILQMSLGLTMLICLAVGIYDWIREYTDKMFPKKS